MMWCLTGVKTPENDAFTWTLTHIPFTLAPGCAIDISIETTPPPEVRNRSHAFRILEDYRRANHLPWLQEVRVDGEWAKCLLDLEKLSSFLRPLLDKANVVGESEEPMITEGELVGMRGQILAPCAPTYTGMTTPEGVSTDYFVLKILVFDYQLDTVLPIQWQNVERSVKQLREENPATRGRAFLMMRFGKTPVHEEIAKAVRSTLAEYGIVALRADEREYADDILDNVLTYIYGCDFGVAVFERVESNEFNPNVTLEVGYMLALGKPVCFLKDATLPTLSADLSGKLYREFKPYEIPSTLPAALKSWLTAKRLVE